MGGVWEALYRAVAAGVGAIFCRTLLATKPSSTLGRSRGPPPPHLAAPPPPYFLFLRQHRHHQQRHLVPSRWRVWQHRHRPRLPMDCRRQQHQHVGASRWWVEAYHPPQHQSMPPHGFSTQRKKKKSGGCLQKSLCQPRPSSIPTDPVSATPTDPAVGRHSIHTDPAGATPTDPAVGGHSIPTDPAATDAAGRCTWR